MSPGDIVNKLWNYCHVLRDKGMSYGDYVEQLTYLLFLKMADERTTWESMNRLDTDQPIILAPVHTPPPAVRAKRARKRYQVLGHIGTKPRNPALAGQ